MLETEHELSNNQPLVWYDNTSVVPRLLLLDYILLDVRPHLPASLRSLGYILCISSVL